MIKNKIDFKLINTAIIFVIIFLIYQTRSFWLGLLGLILKIFLPFFIAFTLAYAFYPIVKKLTDKKVPKAIAVFIVIFGSLAILVTIISLITPVIIEQTTSLFNGIISFVKEISDTYNIHLDDLQNTLALGFNDVLTRLGTYISNGALSFIGISIDYISKILIIFAAFIYFLYDMDKIRKFIKDFFKRKSKRTYNYVWTLDKEMGKYITGFMKIVIISFLEYTIVYFIIGHPNAIMLGSLAAIGNLIPYFGGIITNIIAAITAFVISPELFIKTCIVFIIFSAVDGYVINPLVYGKSNKIHPLVVIISVFAGGILGGILGIIIALPISILIIATLKYYRNDIMRIKKRKKPKKTFDN